MKSNLKEKFTLEHEIITPIHIGNGEKIPKTEFAFFPEEQLLRKVDFDKFFEIQPPQKIGELVKFIRAAKNEFFSQILRLERLDLNNTPAEYDLNFLFPYSRDHVEKLREILSFIKTPFLKPYIPGSSIKGWFRTAILYYYITKIREAKDYLEKFNKKLDRLPRKGRKLFEEKKNMRKIFEDDLFGADPREDIFRFIALTDTNPIDSQNLLLGLINIYHPTKRRNEMQFESLGFPIFIELLKEGVKISNQIIFDKNLDKFKKKYLSSNSISSKIREFILGDLIEREGEEKIRKICQINNFFSKNIIEYNYNYLNKLNNEISSPYLENLMQFYENRLREIFKEITSSNKSFLMRLGFGTEWTSKTIGHLLIDYFLNKRQPTMDFNVFFDRLNRLQLFKGQTMHKHFKMIPISRAYVVNNLNIPQFPLGWVKVEIKS
ncbi:MAG: type III-A CRISPR-associated RAMP protein Csm5 [Promethearchaeota archaeon]